VESAFLKDPFYAWFAVIFALTLGVGAIFAMVSMAHGNPSFLGVPYLKFLGLATVLAIGMPALNVLLGGLGAPKTLTEAYLLRGGIVGGWRHVLVCYAIWVGVALGGLVALLRRRH
jgi:hypothetical protein